MKGRRALNRWMAFLLCTMNFFAYTKAAPGELSPLTLSSLQGWWPGDGSGREVVAGKDVTDIWPAAPVGYGMDHLGNPGKAFSFNGGNGMWTELKDPLTGAGTGNSSFTYEGPFTLEFWVKAENPGQSVWTSILSSGYPGSYWGYRTFQIELDGAGNYRFDGGNGELYVGIGPATTEYKHIGVTYDGQRVTTYLNGVQKYSGVWNNTPLMFQMVKIGVNRDNNRKFVGLLDDVKFYSRVLTPTEIRYEYGPIAYYPGDGSGRDVIDNKDVTDIWTSTPVGYGGDHLGNPGKAFSLNGWHNGMSTQVDPKSLTPPWRSTFTYEGPFLLEFWAKANHPTQSRWTSLISTGFPGGYYRTFQIELDGNGNYQFEAGNDDLIVLIGPATMSYQHIAVAYDGALVTTYLNGDRKESRVWDAAGRGGPLRFDMVKIGVNRDQDLGFDGLVDEVKIYALPAYAHPVTLAVAPATGTYGGVTTLQSTLTANGAALSGLAVNFTLNGKAVGTATTDRNGVAVLSEISLAGLSAGTYLNKVEATFAGDATFDSGGGSAHLTVLKARAVINWPRPADITYGTPLSGLQLNATATHNGAAVAGSFTYAPRAENVLNAGPGQPLTVSFLPTDSTNYDGNSATVTINVLKARAVINWPRPADITYGTPLSGLQLNATATHNGAAVTGTFDYSPSTGAVQNAGSHSLNVVFTPSVSTNYDGGSASVTLTIQKAPVAIVVTAAPVVYDGQSHGAVCSASDPGGVEVGPVSIKYDGSIDPPVNSATYAVTCSFAGAGNYLPASASAALTIAKAPLTIKANDATKEYGAALPAFAVTYKGFIADEGQGVLAGVLSFTTAATETSLPGTYPVTPSGLSSQNYMITFRPGTLTITYGICVLFDQNHPAKSGSTIPIKLQLCSTSGANVSSSNLLVRAQSVISVATSASVAAQDAGGANPDNIFRFTGDSYIFNLKTTGMGSGAYHLTFNVSSDSVLHRVQFQVR